MQTVSYSYPLFAASRFCILNVIFSMVDDRCAWNSVSQRKSDIAISDATLKVKSRGKIRS